jgi:nitrogen-specific signal transduction histidine kinase
MPSIFQTGHGSNLGLIGLGAALGLFAIALVILYFIRRMFQNARNSHRDLSTHSAPRIENESAFVAASMQGVIKKLREQEKELEQLHREEKERAEHTERLSEEVTRNMPAGLLLVNATGIIASANPAAEQALGIRGLGFRRYSEVLGEKSDLTKLLSECMAKGAIFRREQVEHTAPGGDVRRLGVTISPTRRANEKINGAICLLSDLTELATLQQQVQLQENLAALGELSAGIAHEFKNALATISGYAQMICSETVQGEAFDYAQRILEQTQNVTHVVTELLKYARPLTISSEPVQLQSVVERAIGEASEALPGVRVRLEGEFGNVTGDDGLLRHAVLNLVRNAAEACADMPNGGKVLVRGEVAGNNDVALQRVTVFDNGPGIAESAMPKLFRPFFTTKANGTGLGLAVVQKIIVQHGGRVQAKNRPEGGAAFMFTLPITRGTSEGVQLRQSQT